MDEFSESAKPLNDPQDRFLVLVVRYFDNNLNDEEFAEFQALLRSNEQYRRELAAYSVRASLIRESAETIRHDAVIAQSPKPTDRSPRKRSKRYAAIASVVAASALIAIAVWKLIPAADPPQTPAIATIQPISGSARLVSQDGNVRTIDQRIEIRPGDQLQTHGPDGAATIVYGDGTRVELAGDTAIACSGETRKRIRLNQGTIVAMVQPQPAGNPMLVETATASIEVRGTEFVCRAFPDRTEVSVAKGIVRVTRTSDGQGIDLAAGNRVVADDRPALIVEDIPRRAESWDLDFEAGLPPGMHRCRFVSEGLPRGSKGGVAAIRSTHPGQEDYFEIVSPEMWDTGLFTFHPDSHLHVTYKFDRPQWINVFVIARSAGPNGAHVGNYLFNDPEFVAPGRVGKWQTASIPLAKLRRAGSNVDDAPGPNEIPYLVTFSSQGDRGLVIDRVWVTRGGPGVIRYQDVE